MGFVPLYDTSNYFSKKSGSGAQKYCCSWCGFITSRTDITSCPHCGMKAKGIKPKKLKKVNKSSVSKGKRQRVFRRDGHECVNPYCEHKGKREVIVDEGPQPILTIDHIVPLARGGNNKDENLQTLCRECNGDKAAKVINYRLMQKDLTRYQNEVLAYLDGKRRIGHHLFISPTQIGREVRGIVRYDKKIKRVTRAEANAKLMARRGSLNYELMEMEEKITGYVQITVDVPVYAHSSWASPICKKLVERGYVERNEKGHYRINWEVKYY